MSASCVDTKMIAQIVRTGTTTDCMPTASPVIITASASYLISWSRGGAWVLIGVGAYSMFSPFLHHYLTSQFAFWNDLFIGVFTIGVGAALGAASIEYGQPEGEAG